MVTSFVIGMSGIWLLLAKHPESVLHQLDQPRRTAVVMALLALVLTGLLLVTCAMVGAHWVRRLAKSNPKVRRRNASEHAVRNERLRESLASVLPETKTSDTVHLGKMPGDTKVDL